MLHLTAGLAAALLLLPPSGQTLELKGQTSFVAVPTQAKLTNFRWYAFDCCAVYYLTLEMPEGASADLGQLHLEQIRGVEPAFYNGAVPVTAFIGTPRQEGRSVPVTAAFSTGARTIDVQFNTPVAPGETITVAFKAGTNPPADIYTFSLSATPAGPNPVSQVVGVVQMDIFQAVF